MSIRIEFIERFGEVEAMNIEKAANEHQSSGDKGSDPFKWALLICIGYQCMELEGYREGHNIETPWDELKRWIKDYANLDSHTGDCDYLALLAGTYSEFFKKRFK